MNGAINGVATVFCCSLFESHQGDHKCYIDGMTLTFPRSGVWVRIADERVRWSEEGRG